MRFKAKLTSIPSNLVSMLNGTEFKKRFKLRLSKVGAEAVQYAKVTFRRGGTTKTATAVRSGRLVNSYGYQVHDRGPRGFELDYGPIKASRGEVVTHARVHEGYNAAGNKVEQFVIRPKAGKVGRFPLRRGGGLSKGSIVGWRTYTHANPVILKPRPTFPAVTRVLLREIPSASRAAFVDVFGG